MLSIISNWIFIIVTTYLLGFAILKWIVGIPHMYTAKGGKKCVYQIKRPESPLIAGLIAVTIYAQMYSLIGGVGLWADVILSVVCIVILVRNRNELFETLYNLAKRNRGTAELYISLAVFILFAYGTSHGLMHYDTDLYHAQSIRWIEEYGAVRGLGNLHLRLGYNSSAFSLSALYSMRFLGQSLHAVAGYFAFLLALQCVGLVKIARRRQLVLSDYVRLIALYYLYTVYDEVVSPASDYFMTTMILYIIMVWLDLYTEHERSFLPHALLSLAAVYAVTLKLSAAPMVLLAVFPIYRLIKKRKKESVRPILYCVLLGIFIVFPFIIRNVILTGYLVYPVTSINIISVPWKVPLEKAVSDAHEIIAYGRGYTDPSGYYESIGKWFPKWISELGTFNKIMFIADIFAFFVYMGSMIYCLVLRSKKKQDDKKKNGAKIFKLSHRKTVDLEDFLFVETIVYISLLYFIFSSPLVRYGCVYIWLPITILVGRFATLLYNHFELIRNRWVYKLVISLVLLFVAYKSVYLVLDDIPRFRARYLFIQQDYNTYDLKEKKINNISFYYPGEGDRTGYDPFPAAPSIEGFELMGDTLKEGFIAGSS